MTPAAEPPERTESIEDALRAGSSAPQLRITDVDVATIVGPGLDLPFPAGPVKGIDAGGMADLRGQDTFFLDIGKWNRPLVGAGFRRHDDD